MSIVGNVFLHGPSTPAGTPLLRVSGVGAVEVFLEDNVATTAAGAPAPDILDPANNVVLVKAAPSWPAGLTARPARAVADHVRNNVGARPWDRDAIDSRIVEQAINGEGDIIDSEQEVGGYPNVTPTTAPFNPDEWDLGFMLRR
jgi:hypothetical protein